MYVGEARVECCMLVREPATAQWTLSVHWEILETLFLIVYVIDDLLVKLLATTGTTVDRKI